MKSTCWFLLGADHFGLAAKPLKKKKKRKKEQNIRFYSDNFDILAFLLGSTKEPQKKLAKMLRETSSTKSFPFEHVKESKGNEEPDSQKCPQRACHQFT